MAAAGYSTPYKGKWHCSKAAAVNTSPALKPPCDPDEGWVERQRRREASNLRAVAFLEGTLASVVSRRCAHIVGGTWFVGRSTQSDRHAGVVAVPVKGEGEPFAYVISATVGRNGALKIKRSVGTG